MAMYVGLFVQLYPSDGSTAEQARQKVDSVLRDAFKLAYDVDLEVSIEETAGTPNAS